jgi:hypothetical protein
VLVVTDDGVYMVAGHNAFMPMEVKVALDELCSGGYEGGQSITEVRGRTVESGTG